MKIQSKISVDLVTADETNIPIVEAKQGDTAREVAITLFAGGSLFEPSNIPRIYIKKPDGTIIYNECDIVGSEVVVKLTNQALAAAGLAQAELQMIDGSDLLSTPVFILKVNPTNIDDGAIESQDEFGALEDALRRVGNIVPRSEIERTYATKAAVGTLSSDLATLEENAVKTADKSHTVADCIERGDACVASGAAIADVFLAGHCSMKEIGYTNYIYSDTDAGGLEFSLHPNERWDDYDFLLFTIGTYGNLNVGVACSVDWFRSSHSGERIMAVVMSLNYSNPATAHHTSVQVWKGSDESRFTVFVKNVPSGQAIGVRMNGIKFSL